MGILMDYTATPATTIKPVGENGPAIEGFALDPFGLRCRNFRFSPTWRCHACVSRKPLRLVSEPF